jgi:hypothetical protein
MKFINMVYEVYGLTDEEIAILEGERENRSDLPLHYSP